MHDFRGDVHNYHMTSSHQILSSGIFSAEPGQRLLSICDSLTRRAFQGLYAKCKDNVQGNYYQTGLKRVHVWSDDIVHEDIEFVRNTCPDIDETYEMCFVHYVEERFRGSRRPVVNCPLIIKFVRRFLESVAMHEHLQTAEFFTTRDVLQKRITCMDACRQAFYSLVNTDSVRVETESTVSRGTAPPPSEVSHRAPTATDVVLESEEPDIMPSDSISQIDVPNSVVSVSSRTQQRRVEEDQAVRRDAHEEIRDERDLSQRPTSPIADVRPPPSPPRRAAVEDRGAHGDERRVYKTQEEYRRTDAPPAPSSYISTASSTTRRRADDARSARRDADEKATIRYHPELMEEARSDVSRHDFEMVDNASVASLRTRSAVGSRDSSVSIGMKRLKSPRSN